MSDAITVGSKWTRIGRKERKGSSNGENVTISRNHNFAVRKSSKVDGKISKHLMSRIE